MENYRTQAIQNLLIYNEGRPSCIMYGVFDARPFHEIPEDELFDTDIFPLSYEEAMELEEIDAFNEEMERVRDMGIEEDEIDYETEMDDMALLYDMRDILQIAAEQNNSDILQLPKQTKKSEAILKKQQQFDHKKNQKLIYNYRKPKRVLQQPQSRHMFVRGI